MGKRRLPKCNVKPLDPMHHSSLAHLNGAVIPLTDEDEIYGIDSSGLVQINGNKGRGATGL
eukprot:6213311-Pleurochrysis_carterae.AAC.10